MRDINTICRTCLRSSIELSPLFGDTKLPHKIQSIASVEVSDEDNLPKNVCVECIANIDLSYNFRNVIINSDLELRERCQFLHQKPIKTVTVNINNLNYSVEAVKCEIVNDSESNQGDPANEISQYEYDYEETTQDNQDNYEVTNKPPRTSEVVIDDKTKRQPRKKLQITKNKKQKSYQCQKCDFNTKDYNKYRGHTQNHVLKICPVCGKFISASNLHKHFSMHSAPPVACEECGKICKNIESLRSHLLIHKGINRKCKVCGERFTKRAAYFAHLKTHKTNEEKTTQCSVCNKTFDKRSIKKHLRSHTGERPYQCEFCKKGFSSGYALKTHRRQHTNERPYKCALCPLAFPQKVSLKTHLKSKHQKGTDNV